MPTMEYQSKSKTFFVSFIFYFLLIIGVSLQLGGSNWDIVWHGSKKVESFLTPPHAVIYSGVAITIGSIIARLCLSNSLTNKIAKTRSFLYTIKDINKLPFPFKLSIIGALLQITAGPFDFWWHTKFGFDGLLSPPHSVLATGMLLVSLGAMIGIYKNLKTNPVPIIGNIVFLISSGVSLMVSMDIILMFTLPFSKGQYFDFNPEPFSAIFEAIIFMPFIMSIFLSTVSSKLKVPFTFTLIIAAIVIIQASATLISNSYFIETFPYYLLNIIPALLIDLFFLKYSNKINKKITMTSRTSPNTNNSRKSTKLTISIFKNRYFIASAVLSLFFIPLFFPWIGDVFGGFFKPPNELRTEQFLLQILFPIILPVIIPISFASSTIGSLVAQKLIKYCNKR
jgi:hypothetical protein